MIHHLSMSAQDPYHVACVVAELLNGACVPFPPSEGGYLAYAPDGHGTGVEVLQAGMVMQPDGPTGARYDRLPPTPSFSPTHFALSVSCTPERVMEIARRENWECHVCSRGNDFDVIELWIENRFLVEVLPPSFAARYLAFTAAFAAAPHSLASHVARS